MSSRLLASGRGFARRGLSARSIRSRTQFGATMTAFDYRIPAELFPCKSDAGLFPTSDGKLSRRPGGYGRFAHAAYAIRFAIEELPSELLPDACLEVNAEQFDSDGIRRLYDHEDYPLVRRIAAVERMSQSEIRFRT
jgi:hypothetical protein